MAKIINQEHKFRGELVTGDKVALYVNETKFKEYTVTANNKGLVTFHYQETEITE